jgi:hypothetical protein
MPTEQKMDMLPKQHPDNVLEAELRRIGVATQIPALFVDGKTDFSLLRSKEPSGFVEAQREYGRSCLREHLFTDPLHRIVDCFIRHALFHDGQAKKRRGCSDRPASRCRSLATSVC